MKLEKANRDLELQRKMTQHYQKLNQIARRKLKATQEKLKEAKGKRPNGKRIKAHQHLKFWLQIWNMLLRTLEGHAPQFWAHFDNFWFFGIFGFLVKNS